CNRSRLERDDFSSNRHPALAYWWSMIFIRTPVSTFRDHALPARGAALRYHLDDAVGGALVNEQVAFSRRSSVPKYAGVEPARRDRPALERLRLWIEANQRIRPHARFVVPDDAVHDDDGIGMRLR